MSTNNELETNRSRLANLPPSTFVQPAAPPAINLMPSPPIPKGVEFSIITCSRDDNRFNQMSTCYNQVLQGEDFEIIRIADATGLAEGYNRGAAQAKGKTLIFSHDDAAPVRPFAAKLRSHLRTVDVVAGAGTDRLDGPAWFTAGIPHTFGQVLNALPPGNPTGKAFALTIYGVPNRLVKGIQAFDGFWFAMPAEVLQDTCVFDERTCNSFHMYDVDFSYRMYRKGRKIGVATDLNLMHASVGGYADPKWRPAADKWLTVHGDLLPHRHDRPFQFASVMSDSVHEMLSVMDDLVERASE